MQTCKPYPLQHCNHHDPNGPYPNCGELPEIPIKCENYCIPEYNINYYLDKHFGISNYIIPPEVTYIQEEIMTYGPVMASIIIYEDFEAYKSGVYRHITGAKVGTHSLKILGWGINDNTPYWLCTNSWNQNWGDNGYIKFLRGHDECGIESMVAAGIPKIE